MVLGGCKLFLLLVTTAALDKVDDIASHALAFLIR